MQQDNEGFLYPKVDSATCIDCGLCEKVCPVLQPYGNQDPVEVFAAINKNDEIRLQSSSGGIFTLLAEKVIDAGGAVFGARFDENWQVTLDYTETKDGLSAFRGSKYVQARTADTYAQCEKFLKDGRKVLYSGTPCQIAGLKHFLRKEYDNLLAVDILCHGAPSPKVWSMYLDEVTKNVHGRFDERVREIRFRDKSGGWKKYHFVLNDNLINECFSENIYMKAFLQDLILRPSCYTCPARSGRSHSDITIADYWGIHLHYPELDDDKGTGLVLVHTAKGAQSLPYDEMIYKPSSIEGLAMYNGGLKETTAEHSKRDYFFAKIDSCNSISSLIERSIKPTIITRTKKRLAGLSRKACHLLFK